MKFFTFACFMLCVFVVSRLPNTFYNNFIGNSVGGGNFVYGAGKQVQRAIGAQDEEGEFFADALPFATEDGRGFPSRTGFYGSLNPPIPAIREGFHDEV